MNTKPISGLPGESRPVRFEPMEWPPKPLEQPAPPAREPAHEPERAPEEPKPKKEPVPA